MKRPRPPSTHSTPPGKTADKTTNQKIKEKQSQTAETRAQIRALRANHLLPRPRPSPQQR
eukprot:6296710-Prorocentrum_lima.AAC.1